MQSNSYVYVGDKASRKQDLMKMKGGGAGAALFFMGETNSETEPTELTGGGAGAALFFTGGKSRKRRTRRSKKTKRRGRTTERRGRTTKRRTKRGTRVNRRKR